MEKGFVNSRVVQDMGRRDGASYNCKQRLSRDDSGNGRSDSGNESNAPSAIPCSHSDNSAPERGYIGQGSILGPGPTFRPTGAARKHFREELSELLCKTPNHPLSFLLDAAGAFHRREPGPILDEHGRNALEVVEAGHRTSARSFRDKGVDPVDELGVQSRYFNQSDARSVESKGVGFSVENTFYNVEGVPVEYRTLRAYRDEGLIDETVFQKAVDGGPAQGWTKQ